MFISHPALCTEYAVVPTLQSKPQHFDWNGNRVLKGLQQRKAGNHEPQPS